MENLSDILPSKTNGNVSENHILNNEEDVQTVNKVNLFSKEDNDMFLNESNNSNNRYNNSLNEVNKIDSNDIYNSVITDKDATYNDKKKQFINSENEQDSGVYEDIPRQECEVSNVDNSLNEHNESVDKDDFFPDINKDNNTLDKDDFFPTDNKDNTLDKDDFFPAINKDINNTLEEGLIFDKGILEEEICDDRSPLIAEAEIHTDSALSEHLSPEKGADESDSEQEDQERHEYRSTRKDLTLPYFQLPKPDLDEFLLETEKNLEIPVKSQESKLSEKIPVSSKPKQKEIITLKPPPSVKGNFFDPKKVFITFDLSSDSCQAAPRKNENISETKPKISSGSLNNDYEKVLLSLDADEKTPGVKRLALKEFLKKQIDQKKYEAFNQCKILNNMDEEMEEAFEKEEDLETDDEDSSEEYQEATVSFKKNDQNSEDENSSGAVAEAPEEFQLNDENSDEESDDDFIGIKKTKKKFLVLEEDSCDADDFINEKKRDCELSMDDDSSDLPGLHDIFKTKLEEHSDKLNLNNAEIGNRDLELSKNKVNAFETGIFQTAENSIFSQISSSMPSFQPGGGFLNQDHRQEDSSESIISSTASQQNTCNTNEENSYLHLEQEQNLLGVVKTPVLEKDNVLEDAHLTHSENSNNFGIKLDDLPVSQAINDSDIFLTEELADVCSGAFNKEASSYDKTEMNPKLSFKERLTEFFDDEAELSGEDDGIDEKDDSEGEEDNLDLYASDEENLPEAEVLREEIADLHMKRLMDDDEERIKEIQEQFLDDGELNNDGAGRSRRFAWLNNDVDIAPTGNNSDSDSDAEAIDDSLALNQEKAKWRQENKEDENEDLTEELNSSGYRRKSFLKVDIIGKPKFSQEDSSRRLSCKRPRGSYLSLDDSSATQVLKKLKASEDNLGGSRTTKHFVFRNDVSDAPAITKGTPKVKSIAAESPNSFESSRRKSVFSKI